MITTGGIDRWEHGLCRIVGILKSRCGKSLRIRMGSVSAAGEIRVILPNVIPAYSFLSSIDAHCPGLNWEPPQLRIFIVRCFSVVDIHQKCIGDLVRAKSSEHLRDGSIGESAEWWYATSTGRIHGDSDCRSSGGIVQHELDLRKGWNVVRRQVDAAGIESRRTAPPGSFGTWHFRPADEVRRPRRECQI